MDTVAISRLGASKFIKVARERAEHLTGSLRVSAPQALHRDSVQQRSQPLRFVVRVASTVELVY